jgi:hypothetical protein
MKFAALGGIGALALSAGLANAQAVVLEDGNSRATFADLSSAAGMNNWFVDGVDHLFQQWFWYRIGATAEAPINTLGLVGHVVSNTNFDPRPDTLVANYSNGTLSAELTFGLQGGSAGDGMSDVLEQIVLVNLGNQAMDLSFFQYSDFDLNGTSGFDSVFIPNGNIAQQSEGGTVFQETVVTPAASHWQAAGFPTLLNLLGDAAPTVLNDFGGPLGPGDMTWAYQWDITLAPGQSFLISKDKLITPAPGALALLGLGGLAMARRRR